MLRPGGARQLQLTEKLTTGQRESVRSKRKSTDVDRSVGSLVKSARGNQGWSQIALAERLGVLFQQVQKYEQGSNRMSAVASLRVAEPFGLPLKYCLGEQEAVGSGKSPPVRAIPRAG
ncbi:helix-turn-helix transcriptional regulator [Rhizobium sp. P44RR-XXIV]|uniref:helix-turn-helix domain-containing protein n=1 Tax=Rhizobium sp. AC27/96 TaxID=1841653 RepID=UPI000984F33E|nr:helix-turn-helix transcriptional regulator [Rhizobium sp. P44RR-XXIV]TXH82640.1 MAG: XRE family transcriptional regulator [Rhizobium sp.]